ncbi:DUF6065 family protein [Brucella melitensis]|uniref:DUF6065 family protein n=1 Tax=Brucella melitensis TaxID=29459 RepID=UPI0023F8F050|nr:DUF6065 family protein [Brucella melitensis]
MHLECFKCHDTPPKIVPGRPERSWMSSFHSRAPYRCLPLTMANSTGWEILCPTDIEVSWNGGLAKQDLLVKNVANDSISIEHFAQSHFSHGILTFHTGYLFRTPANFALWVNGAPNHIKDGIQPLTALVETEWLPFPFTMNWHMTRPGTVRFEKGEPFCFIQIIEHKKMDDVVPTIKGLSDDPTLKAQYETWSASRSNFNQALADQVPETLKQGWQKKYFRGEIIPSSAEEILAKNHIHKRKLNNPISE